MPLFQYQFDKVEDYLHHRPPYLMVDRIVSMEPRQIRTEKIISGDETFLRGHFPGAPVVPGAMLQELATQSAGILIAAQFNPMEEFDTHDPLFNKFALGVLVKVRQARFRGFARPQDTLSATVKLKDVISNMFDFSASIRCHDKTIANISFQLTNVESHLFRATCT